MKRVLIVGNSAAGVAAAEAARAEDGEARITIIGEEPYLAYHRPRLTYVLGKGVDVASFLLHDAAWYDKNRIEVKTSIRINGGGQGYVTDTSGTRYEYDSLIIATGGVSNIPPLKGRDLAGVFSLRTYDDLMAIEAYAKDKSQIAIVGGGLLGLEAAWSFRQWGKQVSVLERGSGLLKNQLDADAMKILGSIVEQKGVKVVYGAETDEILGDSAVKGISLKDGRRLETDLVLLSTGVRSEVSLAKSLGLRVNRGLLVDERMQVAPGIYAAGDAAEFNGKVMGIWPVALEQGKVAGTNAAGGHAVYRELVPSNTTLVMGVTVFSAGDIGRGEGAYSTLVSTDGESEYKKFYFKGPRLVGAILIGPGARKALKVKALIDSGQPLPEKLVRAGNADEFLELV